MTSHNSIVVAAHGDDRPSRDALALGIALARAEHAPILLAGIWASPLGPGDALYGCLISAEMRKDLQALRARIPADVATETLVQGSTSVTRGLHKVVGERDGAILVLGPSHLGRVARAVRGDTVLALIHDAPCAIAVAPEGFRHRARGSDVVTGWDGSAESRDALEAAVFLARDVGTRLRVVHVIETPYRFSETPRFDAAGHEHWIASVRGLAQESLDKALAQVAGRVPVETEIRNGAVAEELDEASRDAAYVVVGSRGYGPVRRVVLGSVTAAVLRRASAPVFVLPRGVMDREEAAQPALAS
jgi:nucleotide-binding universal stress UspA family protein